MNKKRQLIHIGPYLFHLTEEELAEFNKILSEHPGLEETDELLLKAFAMVKKPQGMQNTSQP